MTDILFVIAPKNFRDKEYFLPKQILEENGYTTQTASTITGNLQGADGGEASAGLHVNEINISDFRAVLFIGGPGMVELTNNVEIKKLAENFASADKLVAAICVAPLILANIDLLKGRKVAAWEGIKSELEEAGAVFSEERIEKEGNLITASGPEAAELFVETIIEYLRENS